MSETQISLNTSFVVTTIQANKEWLTRCLDSIAGYLSDKCDWELIVVNNGQDDINMGWPDLYPYFKFIDTPERLVSYAYTANYGVGQTDKSYDYICLLHDDIEFLPNTDVVPLIAVLGAEDPGGFTAKMAIPRCLHPLGYVNQSFYIVVRNPEAPQADLRQSRQFWYKEAVEVSEPALVIGAPTGFYLIDRKVWDELCGFNDIFRPFFSEDTDLCFRMMRKKYCSFYQPKVDYRHRTGVSISTWPGNHDEFHQKHLNYIIENYSDIVGELSGLVKPQDPEPEQCEEGCG